MKNRFGLETPIGGEMKEVAASITIIGEVPDNKPYVVIETHSGFQYFIKDKDLKLFAKNLQKAITNGK